MRRIWLPIVTASIVIPVASGLWSSPDGPASIHAQTSLAKAKCHYVTKTVKGKKKRVKVCTKPKPTPTPKPTVTPTATPASLHLIDAGGYVWVDGTGNVYVSSGTGTNGRVSKLSPTGSLLATYQSDLDGAS